MWEGVGGGKKRRKPYSAPRNVMTVAPELVTKTPHCSITGMTKADAIANIKFLTPLEHERDQNDDQRKNPNRQNHSMSKPQNMPERERTYQWADITSALCACTTSTLYATIGVKTRSTLIDRSVSTSRILGFLQSEGNPRHRFDSRVRAKKPSELTPIPLTKRQARHNTKPKVPSTYAFATPNKAVDSGIKQTAPNTVALRRSSGTHIPPRFLRHFLTIRSETCPASGAPTFHVGENRVCK
jgi:hypothetical protein